MRRGAHTRQCMRWGEGLDRQQGTRPAACGTVGAAMVKFPKTLPLTSTVGEVRSLFADEHVQLALVVAADGQLLTTIERSDIAAEAPDEAPAVHLGEYPSCTRVCRTFSTFHFVAPSHIFLPTLPEEIGSHLATQLPEESLCLVGTLSRATPPLSG